MKQLIRNILVMTFLISSASAMAAGDIEAGKVKSTACAACHGVDGNSASGAFPIIAGQHADYIRHALNAYKSGKRNNPIMQGTAAALSDDDIADLSAYFSSQTGLKTLKR